MKNISFVLIVLFGIIVSAQEDILPVKVNDAFYKKYPQAKEVNWFDEESTIYIEFEIASDSYTALYSIDGTWLETGKVISDLEIPEKVINSIKAKYLEFEISYGEFVENDKEKYYRINGFTGEEDYIIKVSPEGKILGEKRKNPEIDFDEE